jgi:hypothetical protein
MLGLQTLLESKSLDIPELLKDRTPNRAELLADKIDKQEPLTLVNGLTVTLDRTKNAHLIRLLRSKDPKALEATLKKGQRYTPLFADKQGNMYALNHFAKTEEFGGGAAGAGGGKMVEERSEIGQALTLGLLSALNKELVPTDLTAKNLMEGAQYVVPVVSAKAVQEVAQMLATDKFWARSFVQVANALKHNIKLRNKYYHHNSPWVQDLEIAWRAANNEEDPKPFVNINKWNPSDIWAVSANIEAPDPGLTLEELNEWVLEHFNKGAVYGISLKKTGPSAQVTFHNIDPTGEQLKLLMRDLIVTKSHKLENLFTSADTYMSYESAQIPLSLHYMIAEAKPAMTDQVQYRSFGGAIQGEIKGRAARHGKVGFGSINAVLRSLTGQAITDYKTLRTYVQDPQKKKDVIDELIMMSEEVMGQRASPAVKKQLRTEAMKGGEARLIAKFQSVQLLYHVHNYRKRNKKKADQFLTNLFQYASSQTPLSSAFVKVS